MLMLQTQNLYASSCEYSIRFSHLLTFIMDLPYLIEIFLSTFVRMKDLELFLLFIKISWFFIQVFLFD